jgi:hypothetical protein
VDVAAHDHWSSKSYALPAEAKVYRERALSASKARGCAQGPQGEGLYESRPPPAGCPLRPGSLGGDGESTCLSKGIGGNRGHVDGVQAPNDYPAEYVARKFLIAEDFYSPSSESISSRSLRDVRKVLRSLYPGLIQLKRPPEDEPHIVEVWL